VACVAIGGDLVQVLGDGVGALAPKFFFAVPKKFEIWGGDGGGLTVSWKQMLAQYYHVSW